MPSMSLPSPAAERRLALYRATLCGTTLVMMGLSWPLWVGGGEISRVPFFAGIPSPPGWGSALIFGGLLATQGLAAAGWRWRSMLWANLPLLGYVVLQDQNRFQPWAYQFAVIALAMAWTTPARSIRLARWYVCGIYLYSGLSKLDASFCLELGPAFLSAALVPFGLDPSAWQGSTRTLACLAMPAFEVAVALLLLSSRGRRLGLAGAVGQHVALLAILGPWGLGHSTIVLIWNLALIFEDILLFGGTPIPDEAGPATWPSRAAESFVWVSLILPAGERLGFCDPWPAHALYASHVERPEVFLHEDDLDRYPSSIRRRLAPADATPWRRLDLTGWSRDLRGTPLYPSSRVGNAIAESLEARYGGLRPVRLVSNGPARMWDGVRPRDEALGIRAIRRRGDQFRLNAHPAPDVAP